MIKVLGIIQARFNSRRLPGKVLYPLIDKYSVLEVCIKRALKSKIIDHLVISTGPKLSNYKINNLAKHLSIDIYNDDNEDNVLLRFYSIVKYLSQYDLIVRITGDSPLLGWDVIDYSIEYTLKNNLKFASCYYDSNWPHGTIVSIFRKDTLLNSLLQKDLNSEDKEHIIYALEKVVKKISIPCPEKWIAKGLRYDIDTVADYNKLRNCHKNIKLTELTNMTTEEIITIFKKI